MSETPAGINSRCPRCGGGFHCGASEARCDCFEIQLEDSQRARLAREFSGCLCMRCLRDLQTAEGSAQD